jgi:cobaltochelatase CobS
MTAINAKSLRVDDVNHAFDLISAHFESNRDLLPANSNVQDYSVSVLQEHLTSIGYGLAANTGTLVQNYLKKRARENQAPVTAADAREAAIALFTKITGCKPAGRKPTAAQGQKAAANEAAPASDEKAQPGDEAGANPGQRAGSETDGERESMAQNDVAVAEKPVNIAKQSAKTATATTADGNPGTKATEATAARVAPKGDFTGTFSGITIADEMVASVDTTLQQATQGRVGSIHKLFDAVLEAETAVYEQSKAIATLEAKLEALRKGDIEMAEKIGIGALPVYKPSGLANLKAEGPMAGVLNTLLSQATDKAVQDFSQIVTALAEAEKLASENGQKLRRVMRDVRAASPKQKIKLTAGDEDALDIPCTVVMRQASEIFTDAFGHSSPILDFEIPTLEWDEPNPDVPVADPSFRFYAPVLADALDCLVYGEIVWLYGESGCGKSEFWQQVAARIGFPFFRLNMDAHLTRADIVGTNRLVPGENGQPVMTFVEGLVPRALKVPSILLLDELDLGDPEIMPVLQPVLEGNGIRLLEDGGRYVKPHEWSRIAVTANTIGLGSANQMYLNAHEQSAATRDRIARYIEMPYLPADKELEVVMARFPDADQDFAQKVIQLANKVRESYRLGKVHQVFSTRTVLRAVRRHAKFAPLYGNEDQAIASTLQVTVLNRCDETSHQVVKELVDNIF